MDAKNNLFVDGTKGPGLDIDKYFGIITSKTKSNSTRQ